MNRENGWLLTTTNESRHFSDGIVDLGEREISGLGDGQQRVAILPIVAPALRPLPTKRIGFLDALSSAATSAMSCIFNNAQHHLYHHDSSHERREHDRWRYIYDE